MKFAKLPSFLLLLCTVLVLSACGADKNPQAEGKTPAITENTPKKVTPTPPDTATSESLKPKAEAMATTVSEKTDEVEKEVSKKEEKKKEKKKKVRKKRPKVKFESTKHNFGLLMEGKEIEHTFKFKNTGDADLMISNATATCGCTTPSYPFIPIKPGETGEIGVTYNSKGKLGSQKPTITIFTNARPRQYKLYLEGIVDTRRADDSKIPASEPDSM